MTGTAAEPGIGPSSVVGIDELLDFCSGPFWPDVEDIRTGVSDELTRSAAAQSAAAVALDPGSNGALGEGLHEIARAPSFTRRTWTPAVGRALVTPGDASGAVPLPAAVDLILDQVDAIAPFNTSVQFDGEVALRADPLLLAPSPALDVRWDGHVLEIATPVARVVINVRNGRQVLAVEGAASSVCGRTEALDGAGAGHLPVVSGRYGLHFTPLSGVDDAVFATESDLRGVSAAMAHLRRASPDLASWVTNAVGYLIPVPAAADEFRSGSAFDVPGVVAAPTACGAVRLAESLVHEAAHQYFFLVRRIAPLVGAQHTELYYSPFVNRHRPLDRILLAYHAVANVTAFYWLLRRSDEWSTTFEAAADHAVRDARVLAAHLNGNEGLAPAGRALHRPITTWLTDRGLL